MTPERVVPDTGTLSAAGPGHAPGRIGPYRIIGQLGEGGMGVVYLAEQDEPVRREVALKLLRAGTKTHEIVARFESERHALELMEHPNITRVFDAGVTDDGLPYFVMERVSGVSITDYATARCLTTRDRLKLLIQVCRAVQHAHQKGVIHRDIKPSNVIVTEVDGNPVCKVIDFGIAKAITSPAGDIRLTATGMVVGTPAYMSPEQFISDGLDIDTRSDIYSLGVLLYELVTGVLPFDPSVSSDWRAVMAQRASGEVPPPSAQFRALDMPRRRALALQRSTDPESLQRAISGDLDHIILKSLGNDREQRYSSASALARDLEHYMAHEPVSARPTSRTYRLRMFVRRHRGGVAFVSVLLALLVTVAIGATVQARRLARARATAVARQKQAEGLIDFMINDLQQKLAPIGKLDLLDDFGRATLRYFAAVPESDLSADELMRRSTALHQLGNLRMTQGRLPAAAQLMQQSLDIATQLNAQDSSNSEWQLGLAHAHFNVGQVEWARGNVDAAVAQFEPFVRISDRLMAQYPDSLAFRAEVAYALNNLGLAREAKGDAKAGLAAYRRALAILEPLVLRDTSQQAWIVAQAALHNAAGVAERKLGLLDDALRDHEQELAIKQSLVRRDPLNREWQRYLAIAHTYMSDMRLWRGNVAGATAELDSAHAIYSALVAFDSTNTSWSGGLANNEQRLGEVQLERGDLAGALRELDLASRHIARLSAKNPGSVAMQRNEAAVGNARARVYMRLGRTTEAVSSIAQVIKAGEAALASKPGDLSRRRLLADSYLIRGDLLAGPARGGGATTAWARALVLVDSLARSTRETDFLALQAGAMLRLGGGADAKPVVDELFRRGYRRPSFVELARVKGFARTT
ncbi:MAG: protein kinase [bacterium]